jgi:hypothetical protein
VADSLSRLFRALLRALYSLAIGWLIGFIKLIEELHRRHERQEELRRQGHTYKRCQVIPPDVYKRPDPLIYSQQYLMSQGLAVTWDNPDIQLYDVAAGFVPVSSHELKAATEYEIRATIYNGSTDAPAIGLPVEFSYLSFGIATTSTGIGATAVDLQVKGAPGHPATAPMRWVTPPAAGHYCIQVNLIWTDDANPANNLGQENTDVGAAHSPAVFTFPVGNPGRTKQHLRLRADSYALPEPVDCDELERRKKEDKKTKGRNGRRGNGRDGNGHDRTQEDWCRELWRRHDRDGFAIEPGWNVQIDPAELDLAPGAEQTVTVTAEPPAGFAGSEAINVNAVDDLDRLVGGVTLYVTR